MSRETVVLSFHNILLHQYDIELLEGPHWLNDTIISFYFEYLDKIVFSETNDILFVSPEVTQCIKLVPKDEIKMFLEPLEVYKKKFIFFALNDNDSHVAGGAHWSLLVFSKPERTFFHLDSSGSTNAEIGWKFVCHLLGFLRQDVPLDFTEKKCLQQSNGYDCGIHLICNAEMLADCANSDEKVKDCDTMVNINPSEKRQEIIGIIENLAKSTPS